MQSQFGHLQLLGALVLAAAAVAVVAVIVERGCHRHTYCYRMLHKTGYTAIAVIAVVVQVIWRLYILY